MDRGRREENLSQQQQLRASPLENHMATNDHHQHPAPPPHKCPRCDSFNTKFCYYNNYSLSQPRYFCKTCRRYWTQGGTLRNVPVGGGSRKSKRARTLSSSLSNSLTATPQDLSPAVRSQNRTGMISVQMSRPMLPPMGNSFYTGGSFLSPLATMQSLTAAGINQGAAVNLGGDGSQFGPNMALLQGISLPPLKPQAPPHQFQPPTTHYFPPQPSLFPQGCFNSWTQSVINSGACSSTAATASFWSCNSAGGNDQAGSSVTSNQRSDSNPGFNPSQ